jgi:hypothetical protein
MADNILGLVFEISADPSKAQAAVAAFGTQVTQLTNQAFVPAWEETGAAATKAGEQTAQAMVRSGTEIREANAAAMILERQLGIHLPRSINTMLASSTLIGPALGLAFAPTVLVLFAESIPKIIHGIENAASALGGFGEAARKAFEASVKASDEALTHFGGLTKEARIATGQFLILQTNQHLAALEAERNNAVFSSNFTRYLAMVGAMGRVGVLQAEHGRSQKEINDDIGKQQGILVQQLKEMAGLESKGAKDTQIHAEAAKETADRLAELLQKEREEAEVLAVGDNKRRQALKTYDDEVRAIDQAIAAARRKKELTVPMEQEAAQAKILALQNYETRINQIEDQEDVRAGHRYAQRIAKAIDHRMKEIYAAEDAAKKITAIEDRYFNELDRDQAQLVARSLGHQQQILQNEIATHTLRGSKAAQGRDQIIAIERQKSQLQAQEEIKRIQLDVKRTVAEINDQYKTLLSAAKTEKQKTEILRQQEAERVQIMQAGEQQIQGILRQTEQEQEQYQQSEEDSAAATVAANISMMASKTASLLQTMGYRKAAAYVEMVMETAAGFASLAGQDYWGAAMHFMSAAEYGIIAKQSVSLPGGGGGGGGSVAGPSPGGSAGGTAAPSRALAPGAAGAAAAARAAQAPQPVVIHINNEFKGPIYGGQQGLDELMRHMTRAVTTRDVRLVASHAVNPVTVSTGKS